jgi:hypothetical protein
LAQRLNKNEVIVDLGAEGGSVTLYGFRTERGWLFSTEISDWTPELLGDEWIQKRSGVVDIWPAALNLLDKYPWVSLYPISVHPDFRQKIWDALQERIRGSIREPDQEMNRRWRQVCGH